MVAVVLTAAAADSAAAGAGRVALLALAQDFSPRSQLWADNEVVIDASGLTRLFGDARELGQQIRRDYAGEPITVIAIINGAILFVSDLMREIDNPMRLDCIRISSYRNKTKSSGRPRVIQSLTLDVRDRHVLLATADTLPCTPEVNLSSPRGVDLAPSTSTISKPPFSIASGSITSASLTNSKGAASASPTSTAMW